MADQKSLMKLKVVDLRERLQAMGKTPKGLKADLVKQLQEAMDEQSNEMSVSGADDQLMRTQEYQPSIGNEPYVSIDDGMESMTNATQTILSAALTQSTDERSGHSGHDPQYYPQAVSQYASQVYDSTGGYMSAPFESQYQYTPHATHSVFSPQHEPYAQTESQYQLTPIPTISLTSQLSQQLPPQIATQLTPQITAQYQTAYQSPESSHYSREYSGQSTPSESLYGITRIDMQTMSQTQPQAPIIHRPHNASVITTGLELPQTATLPPNITTRVDTYDVNSSIVTESLKQTPYHTCVNSEPPLVQTDVAEDIINFDDVSLGVDANAENAYESFEAVPNQSEFEIRVPPNVYEHHLETHRYRDQRLPANATHHLQDLMPNPNQVNQINNLNNSSIIRDQNNTLDSNYPETSIRNETALESNQICIDNYDIESNHENSSDTTENEDEVKADYINNVELKTESNEHLNEDKKLEKIVEIQETNNNFIENKEIEVIQQIEIDIKNDQNKNIEETSITEENLKIEEKIEVKENVKTEEFLEIEKPCELQEPEETLENKENEEEKITEEKYDEENDNENDEQIESITQKDETISQQTQLNEEVEQNEERESSLNDQQIEYESENVAQTKLINETQIENDSEIIEQSLNTHSDCNADLSIENHLTTNNVNTEVISDSIEQNNVNTEVISDSIEQNNIITEVINVSIEQNNVETPIVLSPNENQPPNENTVECLESQLIEKNDRKETVDSIKKSKEKLSKNQKRKQRKKIKAQMRKLREKDYAEDDDRMDIDDDEEDQRIEIEYIPEQIKKDPIYFQYLRVFDKFTTGESDRKDHDLHEEEIIDPVKKMQERKKPVELELKDEDTKKDGEPKLSKRKLKQMTRMTVAELKQRVSHPELVEMHDVTARDPLMLLHLKATRNSVPVPRHWCYKRKYLQGKRGFEKAPFKLPEFIRKTGIMEMRQALQEKEDAKSLKAKMREKIRPKMGKIDIDYQKLHDAFFKWQTKPKMTIHGDLYYEGKEFETRLKEKKPGELSNDLRTALGMPTGPNAHKCPPPWLIAMQRYGPPPSYPNIKIPGLNAPIPEGCSFGYHAGGWGKPPVDEYGRPLYGDVFGVTSTTDTNHIEEEVDRTLWGELESESESEEEEVEEETETPTALGVNAKAAAGKEVDETGFVTPAEGLITPSGLTSIPTGMETPDMIELRKRKQIEAEMESGDNPALYTVIPEKKIDKMGKEMMGSAHTYDISAATLRKGQGVDVALDPSDLEMGSLDTASVAARYEQTIKEQSSHLAKEDLSDMVAEHAARQKRKKQQDTGKSSKKYNQFKF